MQDIPLYNYPIYFPCTLAVWKSLESQANALLGLPNAEKETYSKQFKDINNQIYFIVFEEVSSLVNLNECLTHEAIEWPPFSI